MKKKVENNRYNEVLGGNTSNDNKIRLIMVVLLVITTVILLSVLVLYGILSSRAKKKDNVENSTEISQIEESVLNDEVICVDIL